MFHHCRRRKMRATFVVDSRPNSTVAAALVFTKSKRCAVEGEEGAWKLTVERFRRLPLHCRHDTSAAPSSPHSSTSLLFARAACFYATTVRSSSQFKAHENGGTCVEGATVSLDWSSPREIEPPVGSVDVFSVLFSLLFSFCKGLAPCVRPAGGLLYGLISSSYHFLPAEFMHCTCRHTLLSDLSTAEAVSGVLNPDDRICSN